MFLLCRFLPRDLDRGRVGDRLVIQLAIDRLPTVGIGIDVDVDIGGRQFLAVGRDAVDIDGPLLPFAGPDAAAEAAVGLKGPRTNDAIVIVLAKQLDARLSDFAAFFDGVLAVNECFVLVPFVSGGLFAVLVAYLPVANEPFDIFEGIVFACVPIPLAGKRDLPLPAFADQKGVAPARRHAVAVLVLEAE